MPETSSALSTSSASPEPLGRDNLLSLVEALLEPGVLALSLWIISICVEGALLPAYLLLEPVTTTPVTVAALLVGVNAGPLVTPWASLATLLWHRRLVADGIDFSWRRYVLSGLLAAPIITAAATLPLALAA